MSDFINTITALGEEAVIDSIIDRSIVEYKDDSITNIGNGAFYGCATLAEVKLPKVTTIGEAAFQNTGLTAITPENMPEVISVGETAFGGMKNLKEAIFPKLTSMLRFMFSGCTSLEKIDMHAIKSIGWGFNTSNTKLTAMIIRTPTVCTSANPNPLDNNCLGNGTCFVYVPAVLVDSYKAATNWATYADQFRALEDYTVDGTITGELDETKI